MTPVLGDYPPRRHDRRPRHSARTRRSASCTSRASRRASARSSSTTAPRASSRACAARSGRSSAWRPAIRSTSRSRLPTTSPAAAMRFCDPAGRRARDADAAARLGHGPRGAAGRGDHLCGACRAHGHATRAARGRRVPRVQPGADPRALPSRRSPRRAGSAAIRAASGQGCAAAARRRRAGARPVRRAHDAPAARAHAIARASIRATPSSWCRCRSPSAASELGRSGGWPSARYGRASSRRRSARGRARTPAGCGRGSSVPT